ncbi:MFS general substrate transporter [Dissoconium aciculare CBS 342.82]|uniref:MFS general substrate transporter n=1 Tax=Dissoconium aciculare CBS 342.82 TaxID=1314786 RepID=A0A6J3M4Q7_9PEZI|nr:MFS general substrate transporter [Dissoconium aciculare CBS 342.82]KAF1823015.1 MFS general substrate transporter [Dissoconium aciculare CBS 342.82]
MSLAQHVTSIEGIDRESPRLGPQQHAGSISGSFRVRPTPSINFTSLNDRESLLSSPRLRPRDSIYGTLNSTSGTVKGVRRVISYDAFVDPSKNVVDANVAAVPAYEVSTARRTMQVVVTILACWLASGIVFGFAALKPILVHQGVYSEYCTAEELGARVSICRDQDLRLNAFFAVASTTCNIAALPAGTLLDKYGARSTIAIGSVLLAIGSFIMASAFAMPDFDGYMLGNILLALGGSFIFVPSFAIANAFPKHSGTIVALVTGAFDASAAVFLFYRLAYEASDGAFSPQKFFYGYIIVPVLIFIAQFTLMNGDGYTSVPQIEEKMELVRDATKDVHDSDDDRSDNEVNNLRVSRREQREDTLAELDRLLGGAEEREVRDALEDKRHEVSGVWGALHGQTAWQQMRTPWFILITLLTVLQMLRMNFFIATIKSQYEYMLRSPRLAKQINTFFDVALPVGGVLATPFIGLLLDHMSTAGMLAVLVTLITSVGVLGSLPFLWAAYANVIFFVLLRPLYYSAMSDYATKIFGFATFGKVYGMIICFSGVVNLFQPLIDAANHDTFHDDPAPINIIMAALGGLFGTVLVIFVWLQGRRAAVDAKAAEMAFNGEYIIRETDEESLYL